MRILNRAVSSYKFVAVLIFVFSYILSMISLNSISNQDDIGSNAIFLCSWLGIIVFLLYIIWWKKLTGKYFTPFTIFLLFITLFNFGQCFLWAFGIHVDSEIGKRLVFNSVSANNALILKSQILYIISYIAINTGSLLSYSKTKEKPLTILKSDDSEDNNIKYRALFISSIMIFICSIPVTLYYVIKKYTYTQMFSYHDMYYGSIAESLDNPLFVIGGSLFLISLIGLLIGSRYKKKVMYFVYIVFALYAFITLLGGDRGEWIIPFVFLFWMHNAFYKQIKKKTAFLLFIASFFLLFVINAIVSLRNTGLSYDGFVGALTTNNGAITPLLIEFGQSMGISIIILSSGTVFPYGNTYLMSFLTMFGTGIANKLFGMDYIQLHTWFSSNYLGLNYGTDFSIIGEALLNFGTILVPMVLFIEGMVFGKIFNYPFKNTKSPFILCIAINAMICITKIARSTFWFALNKIALPTLLFALIYLIVKRCLRQRLASAKDDEKLILKKELVDA